jgi:O-antigen/teichoic acid export membrane protein
MIYRLYCLKYFKESKYKFEWDKKTIYPMLSFSGWDLYGNMSTVARTQGVNMLLNMFFGPILNAANAVAIQVQGAVVLFANNIIVAIRPQIVKSYASHNYQYTRKLVLNAAKYTYLLLLFLSLPLIVEMNFVLNLWLKNVPSYAVSFCQLTLLFNFFATMSLVVVSAIHATGYIKRPSLINGSLYLLVLPVSYIAFRFNGIPEVPYICNVLFVFIGMLSNVYTLKLYLPEFSAKEFILKVLSICLLISLVSFAISYYIKIWLSESFGRFCLVALASTLSISGMTYLIAIDKQTKQYAKHKIIYLIQKWKN